MTALFEPCFLGAVSADPFDLVDLLTWIGIGLAAAFVTRIIVGKKLRITWMTTLILGVVGAILGGILAPLVLGRIDPLGNMPTGVEYAFAMLVSFLGLSLAVAHGAIFPLPQPTPDPSPGTVVDLDKQKYLNARQEVIKFRDSSDCSASAEDRKKAEKFLKYAKVDYDGGEPVVALGKLKQAADALGMKGPVYDKYFLVNPVSGNEKKYREALKAVTDFRESADCTAGDDAKRKAQVNLDYAKIEFEEGDPLAALGQLKEAADHLGMKEKKPDVYEKYWPLQVVNPVSDNEQKYLDASNAVTEFQKSPDCTAGADGRDTAELVMKYAKGLYEKGKPEEALEKLKEAADALGMKEKRPELYKHFWPIQVENPLSRDEQKYQRARKVVEDFMGSPDCTAGDPARETAKLHLEYAGIDYKNGSPRGALEKLKEAADALGLKEKKPDVYEQYWPHQVENPLSRDERKYQKALKAVEDFMGSPDCTAGEAGREKAELQIEYARLSYSKGAPEVAMEELKEAADALGMKEKKPDIYELYWPKKPDPAAVPVSDTNPESENERKYKRAYKEVEELRKELCDGEGVEAGGAACKAAQFAIEDANREFGGGKPVEALAELRKAADALGMKERMPQIYQVFWPEAAATMPADLNPVSVSEQKFTDALREVKKFFGQDGHGEEALQAANLYITYAERDYKTGRPEEGLAHLKKAADALGMNVARKEVYEVFWPPEEEVAVKKNLNNPESEDERIFLRAREQVKSFRESGDCEANDAAKQAADFHLDDAEREFAAGKPEEGLLDLKQAADSLGMREKKKEIYDVFWPSVGGQDQPVKKNPNNPESEDERNFLRAKEQVKSFLGSEDCEANDAAKQAADFHLDDAEREFAAGKPEEGLQGLKKAADALGMREKRKEIYDVFWPPQKPEPPKPPAPQEPDSPGSGPDNPVSMAEQKYVDARMAVIDFAGSSGCQADASARKAAELSVDYAEREFKSGEPEDAMKELKNAADALGMRRSAHEIYDLFWPSRWS